jgi:hypothetical protein
MDLAQIDVYNPVPGAVFDAYRESRSDRLGIR